MAINLEEHVIVHSGIKFVPLSIAKTAVEEAGEFKQTEAKLTEVMGLINEAISKYNTAFDDIDND